MPASGARCLADALMEGPAATALRGCVALGRAPVLGRVSWATGLPRRVHQHDEEVRFWHDARVETARVDAWLWAVRLYKTRSAATEGCRGGHVRVNDVTAKAATPVKVGDRIRAFVERERILEVKAVIEKRVGAPEAAKCFIDHSPPVVRKKRYAPAPRRAPGMGRPTKRERRQLDRVRQGD